MKTRFGIIAAFALLVWAGKTSAELPPDPKPDLLLEFGTIIMQNSSAGPNARSIEANLRVNNTGNVVLSPRGTVSIARSGKVMGTTDLSCSDDIAPGTIGNCVARSKGRVWEDGEYTAIVKLGYGDRAGKPLRVKKSRSFRITGNFISATGYQEPAVVAPGTQMPD